SLGRAARAPIRCRLRARRPSRTPYVPQNLSFLGSLVSRRLGGVDRIAEQHAEGALVLIVFGKVGNGRAHGLRAILDPFAEFAVGHYVEFIVEYALQYSLADRFLGAEQMKQVAVLLAALIGLGIARVG